MSQREGKEDVTLTHQYIIYICIIITFFFLGQQILNIIMLYKLGQTKKMTPDLSECYFNVNSY